MKAIKVFFSFCLLIAASIAAYGQSDLYKKFNDESEVPRISVEEAKKAYDDRSVLIVDARGAEIYKQEHIKGAINIPLGSDDKFDSLPKGKKVIVYCS